MPGIPGTAKEILLRVLGIVTAVILAIGMVCLSPLPAAAADGPDLIVQSIAFSPPEPAYGETVSITVTIKNQGNARAPACYTSCQVDSIILSSQYISELQPGMSVTATYTWTAELGSHPVKAVVDSTGIVTETDETNNSAVYTLTPLAPDLYIESISWHPTDVSEGDTLTIDVTVGNIGTARSRATRVLLSVDGASQGYKDVASIKPGDAVTISYSWVARPGQQILKATIDDDGENVENDETNNTRSVTFSTQAPDLVIAEFTHDPEEVSMQDLVAFTVNVTNQGSGRSNYCYLAFLVDDEMISHEKVPKLDADESCLYTFAWTNPGGTSEISAIVDYYDEVPESDENNNEAPVTIDTFLPDLTIESITCSPESPGAGETVTVSVVITNEGPGKSISSRAYCTIGAEYSGYTTVPAIDSGDSATVEFSWETISGTFKVSAVANVDSAVAEERDTNNTSSMILDVEPPDLVVMEIALTPEHPNDGDTVSFTVNITNQGQGAAGSSYIGYYIDGELVFNRVMIGLESGESVNMTYSWVSEQGYHTFQAMADFKKNVTESNEMNNALSVAVVANMPDLVVETVTWSPADLPAGEDITFSVTITNAGTQPAPPSRLAYYMDGTIGGFVDIAGLQPDETMVKDLVWPATGGLHSLEFIVDSTGLIDEIDEVNNTKVVVLPPPDLVILDIAAGPEQVGIDEVVTFSATLTNEGESDTLSSTLHLLVDGIVISGVEIPPVAPGETVSGAIDWLATAGSHDISLVIDMTNMVIESDETNNEMTVPFTTLTPELEISALSWRMDNPLVNHDVEITALIANTGTDTAPPFQLTYVLDEEDPVYEDIPELAAGQTYEFVLVCDLETSVHTFTATVDTLNDVIESDESNNGEEITFDSDAPDIIIRTVSCTPADAAPGQDVTISVSVENRGTVKARNPVISLTIDGVTVDEAVIAELDRSDIQSLDFIWTAEAGFHEINVLADYAGEIAETDETNNTRLRTIEFQAPAATTVTTAAAVSLDIGEAPATSLIEEYWWAIMVLAALLAASVFITLFRAFRKG